jgi:two-component system chemotaxis sensor kinase CheA
LSTSAGNTEQFRQLFGVEAQQRLARLSELLLELEATGGDAQLVGALFREAHTLKGSAAMVGLDHVTAVAHAMEDLLEPLRSGAREVDAELIDGLLVATDQLGVILALALEGTDHAEDAARVEHALRRLATTAAAPRLGVAPAPAVPRKPRKPRKHDKAELTEVPAEVPADLPQAAARAAEPPAADRPRAESAPIPESAAGRDAETLQVDVARVDQLVRLVGESATALLSLGSLLQKELNRAPEAVAEFRDLARTLKELQEMTMRVRMIAVRTVTQSLRRAVRDLGRTLGKDVRWEVLGEDTEIDRQVLEQVSEALLHLVRNAVDHGVETPGQRRAAGKPEQGYVRLHAMQLGSEVILALSDDGAGIDLERVRREARRLGVGDDIDDDDALNIVFRSGLSTAAFVSDVSGRGVGLDVVRAKLDAVRGRVEVSSTPGAGTEFRVIVPITLAVLPSLLVGVGGQPFALPLHSVVTVIEQKDGSAARAEGRDLVFVGEQPVPLSSLSDMLNMQGKADGPAVVVAGMTRMHAFRVDRLLGQRDVVVKGLGRVVPRLDILAGASVEPDGSIMLVLDVAGLIDRARRARGASREPDIDDRGQHVAPQASVLVVDDALTVRELQRSILERAGYVVRTATDGVEALALLQEAPSDIVLTDVEMPRMDGFALTEAIRGHPSLTNLPVLILTTHSSDEDRQRGLDAGADAYIIKSAFEQNALLAAVERMLGKGR